MQHRETHGDESCKPVAFEVNGKPLTNNSLSITRARKSTDVGHKGTFTATLTKTLDRQIHPNTGHS